MSTSTAKLQWLQEVAASESSCIGSSCASSSTTTTRQLILGANMLASCDYSVMCYIICYNNDANTAVVYPVPMRQLGFRTQRVSMQHLV